MVDDIEKIKEIEMAKNIVYILGAGASAHAIPVMKRLPKSMKYFLERLIFSLRDNPELTELITQRRQEFNDLLAEIQQFGTPDIVAKIALHKGEDRKVRDLKNLLTCYILAEQLESDIFEAIDEITDSESQLRQVRDDIFGEVNTEGYLIPNELDNRYVEFLSAILSGEGEILSMPENLSIVSWNYDHQIEKALGVFRNASLKEIQEQFKVFPITDVKDVKLDFDSQRESVHKKSIIKLNGTAGFGISDSSTSLFDVNKHKLDSESIEIMGKRIFERRSSRDVENKLAFAWEREITTVRLATEAALRKIQQAEAVVVIGYSFPNFNRLVDRQIFERFEGSKIYVQDPYPDEIIEKLDGVQKGLKEKAVAVHSGGSFTIPNEFWEEITPDSLPVV